MNYAKMRVSCYHDPKMIMVIDGVKYFCADKDGVVDFDGDGVFNLTGHPNIPQLYNIPSLAQHVDVTYEEVVIAWPDFGLPRVKPTFWQAMHKYAKEKKWKSVCIHCEGGHGRTGTAMAAVLISCVKWSVPKAVNFIRKRYCDKVVETHEQCDYLCMLDEELNGRQTREKDIPEPAQAIMAREVAAMEITKTNNLKTIINKTMGYWHDEDSDTNIGNMP